MTSLIKEIITLGQHWDGKWWSTGQPDLLSHGS